MKLPLSHLDGVAVGQRVHTHGTGVLPAKEVGPDLVLWVGVVNTQVLDPCRKALVQPQVGPPLHGDLLSCDSIELSCAYHVNMPGGSVSDRTIML